MNTLSRRDFLRFSGLGALGLALPARAQLGAAGPNVVIVGGGFGGTTCAKYLRMMNPGIAVTLVEPARGFVTCPFSNYVLAGTRTIDSITHNYVNLQRKYGVNVVHDAAAAIDPVKRVVTLKGGKLLHYDRLVLAPGIDFKWDAIPGYNEAAAQTLPHAWKAGAQTLLLRKQLEAMKDGGVFVMSVPGNPFRCPPGPYERASMIAFYFKQYKPRSKIFILDAKDDFSKKPLFMDGWKKLYGDTIEWVSATNGGVVKSVDPKKLIVEAQFNKFKAAVANIIPPQTAGAIALKAGLADDSGWCPVDPKTFESKKHKHIHVIGDAAIAGALPKSGFAANSAAKITAAAIVSMLRGEPPADASYVNTCYSLIAPNYGISVAGVYRVTDKGIVQIEGSGGVSPKEASEGFREDEAKYALGWYASITADVWG
jgi:sulfide dehydrogenase [flavocytochrome c] flavoprotein subunit